MDIALQLVAILFVHYIADFLCQTDWMGNNKSKELLPLLVHVTLYSAVFFIIGILFYPFDYTLAFCTFTVIAHFLTDFITSKLSHSMYLQKRFRFFFNIIGFDQFLHAAQLILTYKFLTTI